MPLVASSIHFDASFILLISRVKESIFLDILDFTIFCDFIMFFMSKISSFTNVVHSMASYAFVTSMFHVNTYIKLRLGHKENDQMKCSINFKNYFFEHVKSSQHLQVPQEYSI